MLTSPSVQTLPILSSSQKVHNLPNLANLPTLPTLPTLPIVYNPNNFSKEDQRKYEQKIQQENEKITAGATNISNIGNHNCVNYRGRHTYMYTESQKYTVFTNKMNDFCFETHVIYVPIWGKSPQLIGTCKNPIDSAGIHGLWEKFLDKSPTLAKKITFHALIKQFANFSSEAHPIRISEFSKDRVSISINCPNNIYYNLNYNYKESEVIYVSPLAFMVLSDLVYRITTKDKK